MFKSFTYHKIVFLSGVIFFFFSAPSFAQCPSTGFADSCTALPKGYVMVQKFTLSVKSKKDDVNRLVNVSFTKRNTYTITLCNADAENPLIILLYDDKDNLIASSYNEESDVTFNKVTFRCLKSGNYKIAYFFHHKKNNGCGVIAVGIKQAKPKV